jgi:DNA invertase Pin-like site-specific DNA recombinase
MKVAIYARVSTDKQDTANQMEQLRDLASKQGWDVVTEYRETVSGSGRRTRPQFDAVMLAHLNDSLTCCCSGLWTG